jgi:hypothetical protein
MRKFFEVQTMMTGPSLETREKLFKTTGFEQVIVFLEKYYEPIA